MTEDIAGSDKAIRSAMILTKDGFHRRPAVKLAPVLPIDEGVLTNENRAGNRCSGCVFTECVGKSISIVNSDRENSLLLVVY